MSEREEEKEDKKPNRLLEDTYEIDIKAFNLWDVAAEIEKEKKKEKSRNDDEDWYEEVLNVKPYRSNIAWVPKIAIDCLYNFFTTIKNEMGITGFNLDTLNTPNDTISSRVLRVLQKFRPEIENGKDLEELLLDYIEDLNEFNFYPPIEDIEKSLWKLRSYKIDFFKKILEEYQRDKKRYNKYL